jgi:phosphate transport system substrate-binding protein
MLPLSIELAAAYHAAHPHVFIEVRGGDSDIGLKSLQGREVQMAAVSWRETGTSMPGGLQAVPVARDGLALIVHPDNRIARLTSNQVRSIYRGETLTWKALGGLDAEPAVVSREDGSGSRKAFETLIMSGQRLTLDALVMPSSQTAVDYVAHHPAAVAYVSSSYVDERVQPIQLEGVMPTLTTLLDGSYRLTRLLYLCTPYPAPVITQGLLDFALSPSGQALIARRYVALH